MKVERQSLVNRVVTYLREPVRAPCNRSNLRWDAKDVLAMDPRVFRQF